MVLSGKALKKWEIQTPKTEQDYSFNKIVILNAEDISSTNFACYVDEENNAPTPLQAVYDPERKTLNISAGETLDPIKFSKFKAIYYGDKNKDINLCEYKSHFYQLKG